MKTPSIKLSYLEGWLSFFANLLLFGLKYWAGIVSGSVAIIADAWHTLSDSISSVIVLIGVKISSKPADKEHPFGHGRAELIASMIIGIFLVLIGYSFIEKSIEKLLHHQSAYYGTIAIFITIISVLVKEGLAQFAFWADKKSFSNMLKADGWHHRSDAISSLVILIGIFLGKYFWWIDGVLGIFVALIIFYAAYEILRDTINILLGKIPKKQMIQNIRNLCKQICGDDVEAHHFHTHEYGDHTELTFHIRLPGKMNLNQAHLLATQIEENIRTTMRMESTIHIEPINKEQE